MNNIPEVYEQIRVNLEKNEPKQATPIIKEVNHKTIFIHGTWWNDCEICDDEITELNPGKEVSFIDQEGRKNVSHVCNHCFSNPEYLTTIYRTNTNVEIKKFEL